MMEDKKIVTWRTKSGVILPVPPPGVQDYRRQPAIKPMTHEPGEICPFLVQAPGFAVIPIQEWPDLIDTGINNSGLTWNVFNQQQVGSCGSESCLQALQLIRRSMGLEDVLLNPYGVYGRVNGGTDSGSSLGANLAFVRDIGAFAERTWPRSNGWRATPSQEAYADAENFQLTEFYQVRNWEEFGSALLQGWILYWGYTGHAIVGVDLVDANNFIYLNSWGNWGTGTKYSSTSYGYATINKNSIYWGYGVYAFRQAKIGKSDEEWILANAA